MKHAFFYETDIGKIVIVENGIGITNLYIADKLTNIDAKIEETKLIRKAFEELFDYIKGNRKSFTVKLDPQGTEFQKNVWNELKCIPYGETASYKNIASKIGNEKASRAVGMANNKNPILFIIPCHRVIGANGDLVGYAAGIEIKNHLLNLEKINKDKN